MGGEVCEGCCTVLRCSAARFVVEAPNAAAQALLLQVCTTASPCRAAASMPGAGGLRP